MCENHMSSRNVSKKFLFVAADCHAFSYVYSTHEKGIGSEIFLIFFLFPLIYIDVSQFLYVYEICFFKKKAF